MPQRSFSDFVLQHTQRIALAQQFLGTISSAVSTACQNYHTSNNSIVLRLSIRLTTIKFVDS